MRGDAILSDLSADRDHLGDSWNAQKTRPNNKVRSLAKLHWRGAVAGHSNEKNLSHDRADRTHLRHSEGWELIADQSEPFGNLLAIAVDVGAPLELDIDHGQADAGHRAHAAHSGHTIHLRFDQECDELLDLHRGKTLGLGNDGDRGLVKIGKDIHG